jgi:hypothetical protein
MRKRELEAQVRELRMRERDARIRAEAGFWRNVHNQAIQEEMWTWDKEAYRAISRLRGWHTGTTAEIDALKIENKTLREECGE